VASETSRSTRRRCWSARGRQQHPRDGLEAAARVLVGEDAGELVDQLADVAVAVLGPAGQLGADDVEPALEQATQVGGVGLLLVGEVTALAKLVKLE
jgi:hypothetical protein